MIRRLLVCLATIAMGLDAHVAGAQSAYTFSQVQYPGSLSTEASGIDNSGLIVGTYQDVNSIPHGFTYDGATYRSVDVPGAAGTYVFGIDNVGRLLGTYAPALTGPWHAFILDNGVYTSFDYPGRETDIRDVNASGLGVGVYNSGGTTPPHAYMKNDATFTALDVPGAWATRANGVSDAGVAIGTYFDAIGPHGFTWSNGIFSAFDFPGATWTQLGRMNGVDQRVGWQLQAGHVHALLWKGWKFRAFDASTATDTYAIDINDSGRIVGQYYGLGCQNGCGFLATPTVGAPPCDQTLTATYSGGTLNLGYTLSTNTPTTWSTSLFVQNQSVPLWTIPLGTISPAATANVPLTGFPRLGKVTSISVLTTAASGVICVDATVVDTGTP